LKQEIKDRLVNLLESGDYKKGKNFLYHAQTDTHCPLGVLIEMAIEDGVYEPEVKVANNGRKYLGNCFASILNDEILGWSGLKADDAATIARINDNSDEFGPAITFIKEKA
jgi:hypothetical protein